MGGPTGLGTQSIGMLEAVNITLLDTSAVFPDRLPLGRSKEPPVWATVALLDPAREPCPVAAAAGTADDDHSGAATVVAPVTSAATPTRALLPDAQNAINLLFFSLAGSPRTFPPLRPSGGQTTAAVRTIVCKLLCPSSGV